MCFAHSRSVSFLPPNDKHFDAGNLISEMSSIDVLESPAESTESSWNEISPEKKRQKGSKGENTFLLSFEMSKH